MKIYKQSSTLSEEGLKEKTYEFECKKTANGYVVDAQSGFGGKTTRVRNDEILKPDTMLREMVCPIHCYTWFLHGQKEEAQKLVFTTIRERAHNNWRTAEKLINHLQ